MTTTARTLLLVISKADFLSFMNSAPGLEDSLMYNTKLFMLQR